MRRKTFWEPPDGITKVAVGFLAPLVGVHKASHLADLVRRELVSGYPGWRKYADPGAYSDYLVGWRPSVTFQDGAFVNTGSRAS